ncbi:SpoIIE family protein phosphatase [Streptomyces sp. TRM68367]|uniref:SpoIIE family protein phosphatase n=1 Tax=Streptomyces sp. TRM68367 TaxID=2758415 RepID=UPI00165BD29D|nr:SpoIIE family protein phosphatase [Streptomyces sp. TRM68367]MBC9725128.1 SpoIIE family protein phosphatase [Streptomyces sp. TRM68367]
MNDSDAAEDGRNRPSSSTAAAITVGGDGMVTAWSTGALRLLGYAAEEVVGRPVGELVADGDGPLPRAWDGWAGELTFWHQNHRRVTLSAWRYALSCPGDDAQWLLMLAQPDEAAASSSALHDEVAILDWLFEDAPVALTVYDTALRCVGQNAAMSRMVGMSQRERLGRQLTDVLAGPDAGRWQRRMRQVLKTGIPAEGFIVRGRTPADPDHDHVFSADASLLRGRAGLVLGVCATVHDVTAQHLYRERLAILNEASTGIGSTLDVGRTAEELAGVAVPRLADFVSVDLLEPLLRGDEPGPVTDGAVLRRMAHKSIRDGTPEAVVRQGEIDIYPWDSPPARCLVAGAPVLLRTMDPSIASWFADDPLRAARAEQYAFRSWLLVPVRARGTTLGVTVFCRSRNEPFEREDLDLAEEIVTRAAISLDNARRFTRERTASLTLQRSLLPQQLPRQSAVEAAFRYLPASSRSGVGGDWFDVIPLSGARVALVVGDVAGHGLHASASMSRLRTAVRTLADVDLTPDELLTQLDDLLSHLAATEVTDAAETPVQDTWATCTYMVYDPVSRICSIASAGHPPPILLTPDGVATFLDVAVGPPIGLGGLPFETTELRVPEGSEIALYTDGLIESHTADIDDALRRLRDTIARPAPSPEARCDAVLDALLAGPPADDVALLIARTRALHEDKVAAVEVPGDPAAVSGTRSWVMDRLEAWGLTDMGFVTELVVSELVTNAIRYGAAPVHLRLIKDTALICEVSDASSTAPHLRRARVLDEGGRGLLLVAQLTQRWGTRQSRRGKTIWCEQPLSVATALP